MCLLLFSYRPEEHGRLVLIANRDEFYDRPAVPAHEWPREHGDRARGRRIVAGRDLQSGGTWLGVDAARGRFAAVTNFRRPGWEAEVPAARSRGDLTVDFLDGDLDSMAFLASVQERRSSYNGFNLLVFDGATLAWYTNRSDEGPRKIGSGVHALCNGPLDAAWPKMERGKRMLAQRLEEDAAAGKDPDESLLELLLDDAVPADEELPDTGVGIEAERRLAPIFVSMEGAYGTRCSTLLVMDADGPATFVEKTRVPADASPGTATFKFPR